MTLAGESAGNHRRECDGEVSGNRKRKVGLLYDERMCKHEAHGEDHPECPNRIRVIWEKLQLTGLAQRCVVLGGSKAEDKHLQLVHTDGHVKMVKSLSTKKRDYKRTMIASKLNSIYLNGGSSEAAYLAAGSVVEVAEKVAAGELDCGFAIVRPPGHHAEANEAMGFCLFNNVAVAASYLLDERPDLGVNKILIVDWDVHHGNGTQKMFWEDPRVLVFSIHRHESGKFYPGGDDGYYDMVGECEGEGFNINVPWEQGGCGDADYLAAWNHILIPVSEEFKPDIILLSAGFDAAIGDLLGGCCVTPYGYSTMLKKLLKFAQGKIVMALEGGYNLDSVAKSSLACVQVLLEDKPIQGSCEENPSESTWCVIQAVRKRLCAYWPSLANELSWENNQKILPTDCEFESNNGVVDQLITKNHQDPSVMPRLESVHEEAFTFKTPLHDTEDLGSISCALKRLYLEKVDQETQQMQPMEMYFLPKEYNKQITLSTRCYISQAIKTLEAVADDIDPQEKVNEEEGATYEKEAYEEDSEKAVDENLQSQGIMIQLRSDDDSQPLQPEAMHFPPTEYIKSSKIPTRCRVKDTLKFLEKFPEDMEYFRKHEQFKHVFHMPREPNHMSQGMWMLLVRTVKMSMERECWFVVNGVPIRYSIREHALLTGFCCHEYPDDWENMGSINFVRNVFKKTKGIHIKDVEAELEKRLETRFTSSEETKKLTLLYFLHHVVKAKEKAGTIDPFLLSAVDNLKACETFPWGRYTFHGCLNGINGVMRKLKGSVKDKAPPFFSGFIVPLEILAFEAIPCLGRKFRIAVNADKKCPRICKHKFTNDWSNKGFSLDAINGILGTTTEISSILEPDSDEEALLKNLVGDDVNEGIGCINPVVVVDSWREHLIKQRKKIFWKDMYEQDVASRTAPIVSENVDEFPEKLGNISTVPRQSDISVLKEAIEKGFKKMEKGFKKMGKGLKNIEARLVTAVNKISEMEVNVRDLERFENAMDGQEKKRKEREEKKKKTKVNKKANVNVEDIEENEPKDNGEEKKKNEEKKPEEKAKKRKEREVKKKKAKVNKKANVNVEDVEENEPKDNGEEKKKKKEKKPEEKAKKRKEREEKKKNETIGNKKANVNVEGIIKSGTKGNRRKPNKFTQEKQKNP